MTKLIYKKSKDGKCRKYEHSLWWYEDGELKEIISQDTDKPELTKHQLAWKVKAFFKKHPLGQFENAGWV